jgi:hypothetical protein
MSYDYEKEKAWLFTDEGQREFLKRRDLAKRLLAQAGAVRMYELLLAGSTWNSMACVDRMVELGELKEIPRPGFMAQYRVFVDATD